MTPFRAQFSCALSLACFLVTPGFAEPGAVEFFEKKIRPVLSEQCYECHSLASAKLRGGLRVDSRDALLTGGDSGPAIVPGKPEESLLYRAMTHRDPDLAMPSRKPKLADSTLKDFSQWIADGASWGESKESGPPHTKQSDVFDLKERKRRWSWIWESPRPQALPTVRNRRWPAADPDYFILAKLEQNSLTPAAATDPRSWLRRVHFAIIGLQPSPEEIHEFLKDTSIAARSKVVDQLLASPHYGERWARHWMDLVRYAESRGHESDYPIANAYQYRDYLIRAFNDDVPYNQFVMEHVAGDLLDPPRLAAGTTRNESVLATGWPFLGEEVHSPVDIRQDECERLDNKIDVFSKTFLGLTVACARCHDHKFDAISSRDYYALSGFFLSSSYRQVRFEAEENERAVARDLASLRQRSVSNLVAAWVTSAQPGIERVADYLMASRQVLLTPSDERHRDLVQTAAKESSLEAECLSRWVSYLRAAGTSNDDPLRVLAKAINNSDGAYSVSEIGFFKPGKALPQAELPAGTRVIVDYSRCVSEPWKVDGPAFGERPLLAGDVCLGLDVTNAVERVMPYGAARRDPFWNRLKTAPGNENDAGSLAATSRAGQMLCTPTFTLGSGKLHYLIRGKVRVYAAVDSHIMIEGPLHGRLVQVFDSGPGEGPRWLTHDLTPYAGHRAHLEFGPEGAEELELLMVVESDAAPTWIPLSPWRPNGPARSVRELADALQCDLIKTGARLARGSFADAEDCSKSAVLANWLVHHLDLLVPIGDIRRSQAPAEFFDELNKLGGRVQWESKTAVAWFDGSGIDECILVRGKASRTGALAPRGLPDAFPGRSTIQAADASGRYELGRQLLDPANPLVSRVIVNRVWHHLFGRGIVATVDNFGYLGERPSHPELLDQLAWSLVHDDGWSLKRLIKKLVLSSTFAMSSESTDLRAEEMDPANVLLHRMPVRRLEAEAIRDSLLAVSGRLNPTLGGPPVPVHLTEFVIGRGRPEQSGPLDGDGRRSIYTAVRRNFLPTMMLAFDMPTPFSTVGRRNVTNVPAQSLSLMNDPLFHEEARIWAERMLREMKSEMPQVRLGWLFESAYGRLPTSAEIQACLESLAELEKFQAAGEDAVEVWADLCHALLNANDLIYLR